MAGNVWEWVADWYQPNYYATAPSRNPPGPKKGRARVVRGGSWGDGPGYLRVSRRNVGAPTGRFNDLGLRCARNAST